MDSQSLIILWSVVAGGTLGAFATAAALRLSDERTFRVRNRWRDFAIEAGATTGLGACGAYTALHYEPLDAISRVLFCTALLCIALVDARTRLIPNVLSIPGIVLGLAAGSFIVAGVGYRSALLGIACTTGVMIVGELYRAVRGREGMGMGDIKLLLMIGAFAGFPGLLFALLWGSLSATATAAAWRIVRTTSGRPSFMETTFAFGPHLCAAAAIYILLQSQIVGA